MQAKAAPEPGCVVMAKVIELVAVVTVLPPASWTVTAGWLPALHAVPSTPPPGSVAKASWDAAPMVIEKVLLVAPVSVPEDARQRVGPGLAGDAAPGERRHAVDGGERVGGAGQGAAGVGAEGQGDRAVA